MRISSIELKKERKGLNTFPCNDLGDVVILAGSNGSGKTRLLKLVEEYASDLRSGIENTDIELKFIDHSECERKLDVSNISDLQIINYSHYDAHLQTPKKFMPYVIHKAKDVLRVCDYEETALNSLLFIYDMAMGYSEEFKDGTKFEEFQNTICKELGINISLEEDKIKGAKHLNLFGLDVSENKLSPGQQYLVRIAVACYQNETNDNSIFFLDEPELHLHPKALIEVVSCLRKKFNKNQFWIATHSLPLISYLVSNIKNTTVFNMVEGSLKLFRSDSSELLEGLIGGKDYRSAIQLILSTPDEYASNKFALECFNSPETLGAKSKDPQNMIISQLLKPGDLVVDYGVGKGRFFEGLGIDYAKERLSEKIQYYAYDPSDADAKKCCLIMNTYGSSSNNYFNDITELKEKINSEANYVLLVNVLHEISPTYWFEVFQNIKHLLKDDGELIIVERDELTIGEAPYNNCFLVLTQNSANELFGKENFEYDTHPEKEHIVRYKIKKQQLNVSEKNINDCIAQIKFDSNEKLKEIKTTPTDETYKLGLKLAFWLNQYANSSFIIENILKSHEKGDS